MLPRFSNEHAAGSTTCDKSAVGFARIWLEIRTFRFASESASKSAFSGEPGTAYYIPAMVETKVPVGETAELFPVKEDALSPLFERIRPVVSHGGIALIRLGFDMEPGDPGFEERRQHLLEVYQDNICRETGFSYLPPRGLSAPAGGEHVQGCYLVKLLHVVNITTLVAT